MQLSTFIYIIHHPTFSHSTLPKQQNKKHFIKLIHIILTMMIKWLGRKSQKCKQTNFFHKKLNKINICIAQKKSHNKNQLWFLKCHPFNANLSRMQKVCSRDFYSESFHKSNYPDNCFQFKFTRSLFCCWCCCCWHCWLSCWSFIFQQKHSLFILGFAFNEWNRREMWKFHSWN